MGSTRYFLWIATVLLLLHNVVRPVDGACDGWNCCYNSDCPSTKLYRQECGNPFGDFNFNSFAQFEQNMNSPSNSGYRDCINKLKQKSFCRGGHGMNCKCEQEKIAFWTAYRRNTGTCVALIGDGKTAYQEDAASCKSKAENCGICGRNKNKPGDRCSSNGQCLSGWCSGEFTNVLVTSCKGFCQEKAEDGEPAFRKDSGTGWDYNSCVSGRGICGTCGLKKKAVGDKCTDHGDCDSNGYCDCPTGGCINCAGTCKQKKADNEPCDNDQMCANGLCYKFHGVNAIDPPSYCAPKGGKFFDGGPCGLDDHCSLEQGNGNWCNGGKSFGEGTCQQCPLRCNGLGGCHACMNDIERMNCGRSDDLDKLGCAAEAVGKQMVEFLECFTGVDVDCIVDAVGNLADGEAELGPACLGINGVELDYKTTLFEDEDSIDLTLDGQIKGNLDPTISLDLNNWKFTVTLETAFTSSLSVEMKASSGVEKSEEIKLSESKRIFRKVYMLGKIPVLIEIDVTPMAWFDFTAAADFTASLQLSSYIGHQHVIEIDIDDHSFEASSFEFGANEPLKITNIDVTGNFNAEAIMRVGPRLSFRVNKIPVNFDIAGRISANAELTASTTGGNSCLSGSVGVQAGLDARVGVEFPFLNPVEFVREFCYEAMAEFMEKFNLINQNIDKAQCFTDFVGISTEAIDDAQEDVKFMLSDAGQAACDEVLDLLVPDSVKEFTCYIDQIQDAYLTSEWEDIIDVEATISASMGFCPNFQKTGWNSNTFVNGLKSRIDSCSSNPPPRNEQPAALREINQKPLGEQLKDNFVNPAYIRGEMAPPTHQPIEPGVPTPEPTPQPTPEPTPEPTTPFPSSSPSSVPSSEPSEVPSMQPSPVPGPPPYGIRVYAVQGAMLWLDRIPVVSDDPVRFSYYFCMEGNENDWNAHCLEHYDFDKPYANPDLPQIFRYKQCRRGETIWRGKVEMYRLSEYDNRHCGHVERGHKGDMFELYESRWQDGDVIIHFDEDCALTHPKTNPDNNQGIICNEDRRYTADTMGRMCIPHEWKKLNAFGITCDNLTPKYDCTSWDQDEPIRGTEACCQCGDCQSLECSETIQPTSIPSMRPTLNPTAKPTSPAPTGQPSESPSESPSSGPTVDRRGARPFKVRPIDMIKGGRCYHCYYDKDCDSEERLACNVPATDPGIFCYMPENSGFPDFLKFCGPAPITSPPTPPPTPPPTRPPTFAPFSLSPTPAPNAPTCGRFKLELNIDRYGYETGWELIDDETGRTIDSAPPNNHQSRTTYMYPSAWEEGDEHYCLEPKCYTFRITDTYGDGLSAGGGGYTGYLNGEIAFEGDGKFRKEKTHKFCIDYELPSLTTKTPTPPPTFPPGNPFLPEDVTDDDCRLYQQNCPPCARCIPIPGACAEGYDCNIKFWKRESQSHCYYDETTFFNVGLSEPPSTATFCGPADPIGSPFVPEDVTDDDCRLYQQNCPPCARCIPIPGACAEGYDCNIKFSERGSQSHCYYDQTIYTMEVLSGPPSYATFCGPADPTSVSSSAQATFDVILNTGNSPNVNNVLNLVNEVVSQMNPPAQPFVPEDVTNDDCRLYQQNCPPCARCIPIPGACAGAYDCNIKFSEHESQSHCYYDKTIYTMEVLNGPPSYARFCGPSIEQTRNLQEGSISLNFSTCDVQISVKEIECDTSNFSNDACSTGNEACLSFDATVQEKIPGETKDCQVNSMMKNMMGMMAENKLLSDIFCEVGGNVNIQYASSAAPSVQPSIDSVSINDHSDGSSPPNAQPSIDSDGILLPSNNACVNNPRFKFVNKKDIVKGGCEFVAKKPKKRCKKTIGGKKVKKECAETCGLPPKCTCQDRTFPFKVDINGKVKKLRCKNLKPSSKICNNAKVMNACPVRCKLLPDCLN